MLAWEITHRMLIYGSMDSLWGSPNSGGDEGVIFSVWWNFRIFYLGQLGQHTSGNHGNGPFSPTRPCRPECSIVASPIFPSWAPIPRKPETPWTSLLLFPRGLVQEWVRNKRSAWLSGVWCARPQRNIGSWHFPECSRKHSTTVCLIDCGQILSPNSK